MLFPRRLIRLLAVLALLLSAPLTPAHNKLSDAEIEAWFNNKSSDAPPVANPNPGQLRFLAAPLRKNVHHHHNTFIVYKESLENGWVKMQQCHEHLDIIPRAEVLYSSLKIRALKITTAVNIEKAWVDKNSVQLQNVQQGARLCVEADSKTLERNPDGSYTLYSGPFMRRFLDGFFPMRVSMDLRLPKEIQFVGISPPEQSGFRVNQHAAGVHFDAWFEGKLFTQIKLKAIN